jgi:two-component system NarL family response regulator
MKKNRIRILVVDDHPALRAGLIAIINNQPDMEVVAEAGDGPDAIAMFRQHRPDLALLDLRLPGMSGIEVIEAIKPEAPDARVIILTTFADEHDVSHSLRAGAQAYVLKKAPSEELLAAIRDVHAGNRHIPPTVALLLADHLEHGEPTPRELDMLQHLVRGRSNKEIAADLGLTEGTVKYYMKGLFAKLGVADRTQAVMRGLQRGFVHLD